MNQIVRETAALTIVTVFVLLTAGCSKFIDAQSGSKSMDSARRVQGHDLSTAAPLSSQSGRSAGGSTAPSLSIQPGQDPEIPGEMVVARAEPSTGSIQQLEDMRLDQRATAAAGLQDVFFEFDRWTINDEARQALQLSAEWLRSNPNKKLVIQGHCDDRGTSAYNLWLGEKRARSIRQYLLDLGVKAERLAAVSYGKERPFCQEQTEQCYQQNRRGHLSVQAR